MEPISKEYLLLFNTITDTLEALAQLRQRLLEAQQQAEALYIADAAETPETARTA